MRSYGVGIGDSVFSESLWFNCLGFGLTAGRGSYARKKRGLSAPAFCEWLEDAG